MANMLFQRIRLTINDYIVFNQLLALVVLILILYLPLMWIKQETEQPIRALIDFVEKIDKKLS